MSQKTYPETVAVVCGAVEGTFFVAESRIQLLDGRKITGTEFERLGGKGQCKRWKTSIRVREADGEPGRAVAEWMADYGLDIRGNQFINNGEVTIIDGITNTGYMQTVVSVSEMKQHLENKFIGFRDGFCMSEEIPNELPPLPNNGDPAFSLEQIDMAKVSQKELQKLADQSCPNPFKDLLPKPIPIPLSSLGKVTGQANGKQVLTSRQGAIMGSAKVLTLLGEYLKGGRDEPPWEHMGISDKPQINGRKIDLRSLYMSVKNRGGFAEVGRKRGWSQISDDLQFGEDCSSLLKEEYQRFLYKYERQEDLQRQTLSSSARLAGYRQNYKLLARGEIG